MKRIGPNRRLRQQGFTLIELFIVIGLVIVLASMASPAMRDMVGRYRLNAAARDLVGAVKMARVLAVTRNAPTRVLFTEWDSSPSTPGTSAGVFRIEQQNLLGVWEAVDDPSHRASTLLPAGSCPANNAGQQNVPYCYDIKSRYASSMMQVSGISLIWVDPVSTGVLSGQRAILFGSDGFTTNSAGDFTMGANRQEIAMVLANKRTSGSFEGRIVYVDRAGNVRLQPYFGPAVSSAL